MYYRFTYRIRLEKFSVSPSENTYLMLFILVLFNDAFSSHALLYNIEWKNEYWRMNF
jgi:hypothetical protein